MKRPVWGNALLSAIVLLGITGAESVRAQDATPTPASIQTPRPEGFDPRLGGRNFYRIPTDDPTALPRAFQHQIVRYLAIARLPFLREAFFKGDNFSYIEGYLTEFATYIGSFNAEGGQRALADVRRFVLEAGRIEREEGPQSGTASDVPSNGQNAPAGNVTPPRLLTGEELRRVLPNVAIARGHIFANTQIGERVRIARQKMRDGIARSDRTLYDEGLSELNGIEAELMQLFYTLINTPLDPNVDAREAKTQRASNALGDAYAAAAIRRELVFQPNIADTGRKSVSRKTSRTKRSKRTKTSKRGTKRTRTIIPRARVPNTNAFTNTVYYDARTRTYYFYQSDWSIARDPDERIIRTMIRNRFTAGESGGDAD